MGLSLEGATFRNAELTGALFYEVFLDGSDFGNACLNEAYMGDEDVSMQKYLEWRRAGLR